MLNFLGKRVLQLIPTLFFVSILIFSLQQLLPGDPALVMAGEERDPDVIAQYRLDPPVPVQYVYRIKGVLTPGSRSSPAITSAGSPGSNCCSEKIRIDTKNRVGISWIRRRARNLSMFDLWRIVGWAKALFAPCPPSSCAGCGGHGNGRIRVRSLCPPYGIGESS